jgi:hypothetical protein
VSFGSRERYDECVGDAGRYRRYVEEQYRDHPELFPDGMGSGFVLHSSRTSRKLGIVLRRIRVKASGATFWIRPSLVMPYMSTFTDDVEKPLLLLHNGASCEILAYAFGRDHMFWYRANAAVGRCSIVGTTVKSPCYVASPMRRAEGFRCRAGETAG